MPFGMIRPARIASALALLVAAATPGFAEPMAAVIELFTSQGCSACPPADRLLSEYARQPGVVALTFPVDYWDYLGWRDTLAKPAHSARQKAYSEMRGDRKVFTPQAVINGCRQVTGHDRAAIEKAMKATRVDTPVAITGRLAGDAVEVAVSAAKPNQPRMAEVWAVAVSRTVSVNIKQGENSGRTVDYSNVVRAMVKIADWTGEPLSVRRRLADIAGEKADMVVLMVQAGHADRPGDIVAVTTLALR